MLAVDSAGDFAKDLPENFKKYTTLTHKNRAGLEERNRIGKFYYVKL
jgi:hypothetical protein